MQNKILTVDEVDKVASVSGKRVLVGGCFDILHYGHISFLNNAREQGDILIVMLESDEFIKKYKNRTPFHTQQQRAEILAQLMAVDYVIKLPLMQGNTAYADLVKKIKPAIIAVTAKDPKLDLKKEQAKVIGAEVKEVVTLLPFSSSQYATILSN
jgi:FAD synthetase